MNHFNSRDIPPFSGDLDGWSFQPDVKQYSSQTNTYDQYNEFGFDPPTARGSIPSIESAYSPQSIDSAEGLGNWSGIPSSLQRGSHPTKFDQRSIVKHRPYPVSAVTKNGQITPPRSNSAVSSSASMRASAEREPQLTTRTKRSTKAQIKQEDAPKVEAAAPTRKRKGSRKSTAATQVATTSEDDKRKMSLEKNRLAAAKCRINKKERTDQLQRDSHDMAVENTVLKQTVLQMKEEVQQLQTMLMSHSSDTRCKNPESIHEMLGAATSDNFSEQLGNNQSLTLRGQVHNPPMQELGYGHDHDQTLHGDYFQSREAPALPEFNLSADFEVQTPMLED